MNKTLNPRQRRQKLDRISASAQILPGNKYRSTGIVELLKLRFSFRIGKAIKTFRLILIVGNKQANKNSCQFREKYVQGYDQKILQFMKTLSNPCSVIKLI